MAHPKTDFEIKSPTMKSPSAVVDKICGSTWFDQTEIRAPYKNVDKFVSVLPAISEMGPFQTRPSADHKSRVPDLPLCLPYLTGQTLFDNIRDAIDGTREMLDGYKDGGYMDSKNYNAIHNMTKRAGQYWQHAKTLIYWWDTQYNADPGRSPKGWSLSELEFGNGCDEDDVAPKEGSIFTFTNDGPGSQSFTCPTSEMNKAHKEDQIHLFNLLKAAIENVRCAQEAAASVGIYYQNKEAYENQPGSGMQVKYGPKKQTKPERGVFMGPPDSDRPDREYEPTPEPEPPLVPEIGEEIEEDFEEPSQPSKKKKKDNTLLIAGAAALGLLMLKK